VQDPSYLDVDQQDPLLALEEPLPSHAIHQRKQYPCARRGSRPFFLVAGAWAVVVMSVWL
jgi:hypothetical protein